MKQKLSIDGFTLEVKLVSSKLLIQVHLEILSCFVKDMASHLEILSCFVKDMASHLWTKYIT